MPSERLLLETDAPDAFPKSKLDSLYLVEGDSSLKELQVQESISISNTATLSNNLSYTGRDVSTLPQGTLNHPANILHVSIVQNKCASRKYLVKDHTFYRFYSYLTVEHMIKINCSLELNFIVDNFPVKSL